MYCGGSHCDNCPDCHQAWGNQKKNCKYYSRPQPTVNIMAKKKHHTPDRTREGKTLCGIEEPRDHDDWSCLSSCQSCARVAEARQLQRLTIKTEAKRGI